MIYIEAAMVIFMVVFCGIVVWVLMARKGRFNDAARIPLDENRQETDDAG